MYDIWLTSFRDSSAARERTVGTWTTDNATVSPSSQIIDNRPGRNGTTFEEGYNYIFILAGQANPVGHGMSESGHHDAPDAIDSLCHEIDNRVADTKPDDSALVDGGALRGFRFLSVFQCQLHKL